MNQQFNIVDMAGVPKPKMFLQGQAQKDSLINKNLYSDLI